MSGAPGDYELPDWYLLIKAAKYLGVPPWELAKQSVWWQNVAISTWTAEEAARNGSAVKAEREVFQ